MYEKLATAAKSINAIKKVTPKVGIVLGSGLGAFVESINNPTIIPYSEIPFFHETTVEGHDGRLILGEIEGVSVAVLQGRLHAYEGLPMDEVVFPVRVLALLGVENLILTNAAGGVNESFHPGELVIIKDHINLMGKNPLIGPNIKELGPRFPDMTHAYNSKLRELLKEEGKKLGQELPEGIYAGVLGPTYETPSEVRMIRILGGDMVGMSTVPESIAANHLGLKVCGISCITNMAAGIENVELRHEDIKEQALQVMQLFSSLLANTIKRISQL